jgi:hypothetical protein
MTKEFSTKVQPSIPADDGFTALQTVASAAVIFAA